MILGKFMPPHRGHQFLIDFARHYVEHVTILVCTRACEPIPGQLRYDWIRAMFPDLDIVHITEDLPQEPCEHPDFWPIWRRVITEAVGEPINFVFASEDYGLPLADVLGAQFVPVDIARELVPISARKIREDPMRHFDRLPECVRPYFVRRVAIIGPESTGKSTLARDLARHFATTYVWEYARPLLDPKGGKCDADDIDLIARGQIAAEEAMARQANRVLICDTNVLLTTVWSEVLFGTCPDWIREAAAAHRYDLTLLMDVDVPWIDDAQRYFPDPSQRRTFFDRCQSLLTQLNVPYTIVRGSWSQRLTQACRETARLIQTGDIDVPLIR